MKHAALLLTLALTACGADLPLPVGLNVLCASDAECPGDRVCDLSVGYCRASTRADTTPPSIVSAAANGPSLISVVFDEPLDAASANDPRHYVTQPSLVFSAAVLQGDEQAVALTVERQDPVTYTLSVSGVTDVAGNPVAANESTELVGVAATPNTLPPVAVSPPDGYRVFGEASVNLTWTARDGASAYTVDVYVGDSGHPIVGSPFTVVPQEVGARPPTTLMITVDTAATYYWSVRADITVGDPTPGRIEGIGDTLYVSCPAAQATCDDAGRAGNATNPHQRIVSAIADAQLNGIAKIFIAGRGGAAVYDEFVSVANGISLYGGYSESFASHDPELYVTTLQSAGYVLYASGLTSPTTVDGLTIVGGMSTVNHPVEVVNGGGLTLSNCVVDTRGAPDAVESIAINVVASASTPIIDTVHVILGSGTTSIGIHVDAAASGEGVPGPYGLDVRDVTIVSGASASQVIGIDVHNAALSVADSSISITASTRLSTGIAATDARAVTLIRNRVHAGGPLPTAIAITGVDASTVLVDNDVCALGTGGGTALSMSGGSARVVNNTFCATQSPSRLPASSTFSNNIVFFNTLQSVCVAAASVARFENNLLFNCSTALANSVNTSAVANLNDCASYTAAGMTPAASSCVGNVIDTSSALDYFVDNAALDFHLLPSASPFVRAGGLDTSSAAYGAVTVDRGGSARTCPTPVTNCYSVGAYEKD